MAFKYSLAVFAVLMLCLMHTPEVKGICIRLAVRRCYWNYWTGWRCYIIYVWRCYSGKRSVDTSGNNNSVAPFPDKFSVYDANGDGGVTLEELAKATNLDEHDAKTIKAFRLADKDGNGRLECKEFKAAPYLFEHKPEC